MMKKILLLIVLIATINSTAVSAQAARDIIHKSIEAFGGQEVWEHIDYIKFKYNGHKNWLEQSENPEGPFIVSYEQGTQVHSVNEYKLSVDGGVKQYQSPNYSNSKIVISGEQGFMDFSGRLYPLPKLYHDEYKFLLDIAPERILIDALDYELVYKGNKVFAGVDHHIISYKAKDGLQRVLWINANTLLLSQSEIETFLPYDTFFSVWGKFNNTIKYSLYSLNSGGIRYPQKWDIFRQGHKWRSLTLAGFDFHPEVTDSTFSIPEQIVEQSNQRPSFTVDEMPLLTNRIQEIEEGIFIIPGQWYIGVIEQSEGITIIEAPISSGYSRQVLDFVAEKFPGKDIERIVLSADAWPHVAGFREYAGRRIPIITHGLNQELLEKILEADYRDRPDAIEKNKGINPDIYYLSSSAEFKDEKNPFKIIPANGEAGERMLTIYFPDSKILYASDLVQKYPNGQFFAPQYLSEVKSLIEREGLDVEKVFAMHLGVIEWSEVDSYLNKVLER